MARLGYELLDKDPVVAKAVGRFVFRALKTFASFVIVPGNAHAFAPTTSTGFDHHRVSDLVRDFNRVFGIRNQAHVSGNGADPSLLGNFFAGNLITHRFDRSYRRPDKSDTSLFERFGKFTIFRQKSVPGVHGLSAGLCHCAHHVVDHDIRLIGGGWPDVYSLVCHFYMQRIFIGI